MNIFISVPKSRMRDPFLVSENICRLSKLGKLHFNDLRRQLDAGEMKKMLTGMDVCVTGWGSPFFDEGMLAKAKGLKLLVHLGGTVAPHAGATLFDKGIRVISGNRLFAESVAKGILGYMIDLFSEGHPASQCKHAGRELVLGRLKQGTFWEEARAFWIWDERKISCEDVKTL